MFAKYIVMSASILACVSVAAGTQKAPVAVAHPSAAGVTDASVPILVDVISAMGQKNNVAGLETVADVAERLVRDPNNRDHGAMMTEYGTVMTEVIDALSDGSVEKALIARGIAAAAMRHQPLLNFRQGVELAEDLTPKERGDNTSEEQSRQDRMFEVKCWLHAWQRLAPVRRAGENVKLQKGPLMPPPGVQVFGNGMSPDMIADPKLRAQYEAAIAAMRKAGQAKVDAYDAKKLQTEYFPVLQQYLTFVYGRAGEDNLKELEQMFDQSNIDKATRDRIMQHIRSHKPHR